VTVSPIDRFLAKVRRDSQDGCWEWTGRIQPNGYGMVTIRQKKHYAHRAAFEMFVDEIPAGVEVMHSCDNRKCVNPKHLSIGSCLENRRDMARKCRGTSSKLGRPFGAIPRDGKWRAKCKVARRQIHLGTYDTAEEASRVALEFKVAV